MKNIYKITVIIFSLFAVLACSNDPQELDQWENYTYIESLTANFSQLSATKGTLESNPTATPLADRYEAGHRMTVQLNSFDNSGVYIPRDSKWVPSDKPAIYPEEQDTHHLTVTVKSSEQKQDGTALGLLNADVLSFINTSQKPERNISEIQLVHSRVLIQLDFDEDYGFESVYGGASIQAYGLPGTSSYQYIMDEGAETLTIKFTIEGNNYSQTFQVSDLIEEGGFQANRIYHIPVSFDLNGEKIVLGDITVSQWTESDSKGNANERYDLTSITILGVKEQTIRVFYNDGTDETLELDLTGWTTTPNTWSDRWITYIQIANSEKIPIGRLEGEIIEFAVDNKYKPVFRTDEDGAYLISIAAEIIDFEILYSVDYDMIQIAEIDMMNIESGQSYNFNGVYDGQRFPIHNINIVSKDRNNTALFGGTVTGTVKNVYVASGKVTSTGSSGGQTAVIVGRLAAGGVVENCYNGADVITNKNYAGGIAAQITAAGATIKDCVNAGTISGTQYVGGIVGNIAHNRATITGCTNEGDVIASTSYAGGIAGQIQSADVVLSDILISNCVNKGSVTTTSSYYAGGIMGYCSSSNNYGTNIIENCLNEGDIHSGERYCGGIAGSMHPNMIIRNCTNTGKITATSYTLGGIIGTMAAGGTLTGNKNYGTVDSKLYNVGGIAGFIGNSGTISDNENHGIVNAAYRGGGILGYLNASNATVSGNKNYGDVTAVENSDDTSSRTRVAGIVGVINSDLENVVISGNRNEGAISAPSSYVGGIVAYMSSGELSSNYNSGQITGNSTYAGGIAAYFTVGSGTNNENTGAVTANSYYAGGIVGYLSTGAVMENSTNSGTVTSPSYNVGGVIGYLGTNAKVNNCVNTGEVKGDYRVGGIVGYQNNEATEVNNSTNRGKVEGSTNYVGGVVGLLGNGLVAGNKNEGVILADSSVAGIVGRMNNGIIKNNSTTSSSNVTARLAYGAGIVGHINNSGNTLVDCTNEGTVNGNNTTGGITGRAAVAMEEYSGCVNRGPVNSTGAYTGGVSGYIANVTPTNCHNYGKVNAGDYASTGGVFGYVTGVSITECHNYGDVSSDYTQIGGIVGYLTSSGSVTGCKNYGSVSTTRFQAGGIVGYAGTGVTISQCENEGDVSGNYRVGGILGIAGNTRVTLSSNINRGNIRTEAGRDATLNAGGIIGMVDNYDNITVTGNTNYGTVSSAANNAGGIVGYLTKGEISDNINRGAVSTQTTDAGGIVGWAVDGTIEGNKNYADVKAGTNRAGGIVAYLYLASSSITGNEIGLVKANMNAGTITATTNYAGGIVGYMNIGDVIGNKNEGDIVIGNQGAGGIIGYFSGASVRKTTAIANYSTGNITATSWNGGVLGYVSSSGSIDLVSACFNTGVSSLGNGFSGRDGSPIVTYADCYYANNSGPGTATTVLEFSASNWPSNDSSKNWGVASGSNGGENGYYWKSLGQFDATNPAYPTLWWE